MKIYIFMISIFFTYSHLYATENLTVKVKPIKKITAFNSDITALGILEKTPYQLYFKTTGFLKNILFNPNKEFKKGDLLAKLDTLLIDSQLKQAQQELLHANQKLNRARKLTKTKSITHDEVENLENEQTIKSLALKHIQKQRSYYSLIAPFDGIILQQLIDFPQPIGTQTPIYKIKALHQAWIVTAKLTIKEIVSIQRNNHVDIQFHALPGKTFNGKIKTIDHSSHPQDAMVDIDIELIGNNRLWIAGMHASVIIKTKTTLPSPVYQIPLTAFTSINKNRGECFVVNPQKQTAKKITVEFIAIKNSNIIVTTDLSKFDHVIISGIRHLKDNMVINVLPHRLNN